MSGNRDHPTRGESEGKRGEKGRKEKKGCSVPAGEKKGGTMRCDFLTHLRGKGEGKRYQHASLDAVKRKRRGTEGPLICALLRRGGGGGGGRERIVDKRGLDWRGQGEKEGLRIPNVRMSSFFKEKGKEKGGKKEKRRKRGGEMPRAIF